MTEPTAESVALEIKERRRLFDLWVEHGGTFHGPRIEHATIEYEAFYRFCAATLRQREAAELERCAKIADAARVLALASMSGPLGTDPSLRELRWTARADEAESIAAAIRRAAP